MCPGKGILRHQGQMVAMDAVLRGLFCRSCCKEKEKMVTLNVFLQKNR
jgi:hypothetical protein